MYLLNRFRQPNGDDEHTGNESWDKQQLGEGVRVLACAHKAYLPCICEMLNICVFVQE